MLRHRSSVEMVIGHPQRLALARANCENHTFSVLLLISPSPTETTSLQLCMHTDVELNAKGGVGIVPAKKRERDQHDFYVESRRHWRSRRSQRDSSLVVSFGKVVDDDNITEEIDASQHEEWDKISCELSSSRATR